MVLPKADKKISIKKKKLATFNQGLLEHILSLSDAHSTADDREGTVFESYMTMSKRNTAVER